MEGHGNGDSYEFDKAFKQPKSIPNRHFQDGTVSYNNQYFIFNSPSMTTSRLLEIKRGHYWQL